MWHLANYSGVFVPGHVCVPRHGVPGEYNDRNPPYRYQTLDVRLTCLAEREAMSWRSIGARAGGSAWLEPLVHRKCHFSGYLIPPGDPSHVQRRRKPANLGDRRAHPARR